MVKFQTAFLKIAELERLKKSIELEKRIMKRNLKIYIYIEKELYRSMKDCDKELWKSVFVFNPIEHRWTIKKSYAFDSDIETEDIFDQIGAEYDIMHAGCYIYITISKLRGKYEGKY